MAETYRNLIAAPERGYHYFRHYFLPHETNDYRPIALRPHALKVYAISLLVVKLTLAGFLYSIYPTRAEFAELTETKMLELTNASRTQNGLPPLKLNSALTQSAREKAQDMITKGYFDHTSPDGKRFWQWIQNAGYQYSTAGENLAMDFTTAESAHNALMASPTHRANLLKNAYADIGLAVAHGIIDGKETTLLVEHFGKQLAPTHFAAQPKTTAGTKPAKKPTTKPPKVAVKGQTSTVPAWQAVLSATSEDSYTIPAGSHASAWVEFLNTGGATWTNSGEHFIALNTTDPAGRTSKFSDASWPASYRPTLLEQSSVAPGEVGRFVMTLHAPQQPGTHEEAFALVAENSSWIDGGTVTLPITVTASPAPVATSAEPSADSSDSAKNESAVALETSSTGETSVIPSFETSSLLSVQQTHLSDWQRITIEWGVRFFWAVMFLLTAMLLLHLATAIRLRQHHVILQTFILIALAGSMALFHSHFSERIAHVLVT